jgi:hypothetical protein
MREVGRYGRNELLQSPFHCGFAYLKICCEFSHVAPFCLIFFASVGGGVMIVLQV